MKQDAEKIKSAGLKVTPQRITIYNYLSNTVSHPNAEMVYKSLSETNPGMSLATVYKTLESFKKSGLVKEISTGDGTARYDAWTDNHSHIVCTHCKKVYDLDIPGINNIREKISHMTDFVLEDEQLIFYGVCPECQKHETN